MDRNFVTKILITPFEMSVLGPLPMRLVSPLGNVTNWYAACEEVGVMPQLVYAGQRVHSLLAGPDDIWDDIVVVRYESFADLRAILDSDVYPRRAKPHRFAVVADWRFIATRAR